MRRQTSKANPAPMGTPRNEYSTALLGFGNGSIHPARREKHLPTLTFEKPVPGGIAEVSPWRCRRGEGNVVSRGPRNSMPRPERNRLPIWATTV
jgi:hypothetical protein